MASTTTQDHLLKCLRLQYHVSFGEHHLQRLDQLVSKQQLVNQKRQYLADYQQSYVQVANALTALNQVSGLQSEITQLEREIEAEQVELSLRQEAIKQQNPRKFQQ